MKKIGIYFLVVILSVLIFLVGFNFNTTKQPYVHYKVYLDGQLMGEIESKKELEDYINKQASKIRVNVEKYQKELAAIETFNTYNKDSNKSKKEAAQDLLKNKKNLKITEIDEDNLNLYLNESLYNLTQLEIEEMKAYVDENKVYSYSKKVYTPNGIKIEKIYTYNDSVQTIPNIYKKILSKKSCTIAGYKFVIKSKDEDKKDIIIYTIDKDTFNDAIEDLITIFVDDKVYEKYKTNTQDEIDTTGSKIEKIYIDEEVTYKPVNVAIDDKIYTDSKELSAYLLRGDNYSSHEVDVKEGDSIESIAYDNQISVQEFLISNPTYTSRDNLLVSGTKATISKIDPKVQVVVEKYEVADKTTNYTTIEQYDANLTQGSDVVKQEGQDGLERVSQNVKSVNGEITYVDPVDKQVIKSPVSKIITVGTRYVPTVGSISSWGWPTASGYTISSYYGYRLAIFGEGNFHSGIDIAGTGYGSPVYASNNGVIARIGYSNDGMGYSIIINHNNGYYSAYGHMSGFVSGLKLGSTVARGQQIGYVGSSGWATGPHLHFEIRTCMSFNCHINPAPFILR